MPLPQPFPLPQHFHSAVEAGIRAEDTKIVSKYLSSVASSMLCHKLYPMGDEYACGHYHHVSWYSLAL